MKHTFIGSNGSSLDTLCLGVPLNTPETLDLLIQKARTKDFASHYHGALYQIIRGCTHVPLTIHLSTLYQVVDSWNKDSIGWKLVALMGQLGLCFVKQPDWLKLRTMDMTMDNKGKNPVFQSVKLRYHGDWTRLFTGRPKVTMSLQGWLEQHLGVAPSTELLKRCLSALSDDMWDLEEKFHLVYGDLSTANDELFTRVYTKPAPGGAPCVNVNGSCMKHTDWPECDDHHPVEAYNHPSIGLAWIEDDEGRTRCRTLVNKERKTYSRVYTSGQTSDEGTKLQLGFERLLKEQGLAPDYNTGLRGCTLQVIELEYGDRMLAPYIDGGYYMVDKNGYISSDFGEAARNTEGHIDWSSEEYEDNDDDDYMEEGDEE